MSRSRHAYAMEVLTNTCLKGVKELLVKPKLIEGAIAEFYYEYTTYPVYTPLSTPTVVIIEIFEDASGVASLAPCLY